METALWLIIILVWLSALIAAGLYFLIRYWKKQTQEDLKVFRQRMQSLTQESMQFRREAQVYGPEDPEPYGTLAFKLDAQLSEIDKNIRHLADQYSNLRQSIPAPRPGDLLAYFRLPAAWYFVRQQASEIYTGVTAVQKRFDELNELLKQLGRQGWQVASQARQTLDETQKAIRILADLREQDIEDPVLDAAVQEGRAWENTLRSRVPVYFFSAEENDVITQADKETIVHVHQNLSQAHPVVSELLSKANTWEEQSGELKKVLAEVAAGFRDLNEKFRELETSQIHPLVWDLSRQDLAKLRQQIEAVGLTDKTRTLEQVSQDLDRARRLTTNQKHYTEHARKVEAQHEELVNLLAESNIVEGSEWRRNTEQLLEQVEVYDPANWPREDQVEAFVDELDELTDYQEQAIVKNPTMAVNESDLSSLIEKMTRLKALHQSLRPRAAHIQGRLVELQESERNTRTSLSRTRALLNQAAALAGANPYLGEIAGEEIEILLEEVEQVTAEFERPREDTIEKKALEANAVIRKTEQASNRWLEAFSDGLNEMKIELYQRVSAIKSIANVDEPALIEAESLLPEQIPVEPADRRRPFTALSSALKKVDLRQRQKAQMAFPDVVAALKQKNDEWQRAVVLLKNLEEIETPLVERYQKALELRQDTEVDLNHAMEVIPEVTAWPPTTQALSMERRQFKMLEDQWVDLQSQQLKALHFISRLSELLERYQELSARLRQTVERAQQEQERVLEMERHLDESIMLWKYQLDSYAGNPYAQDEIQNLIQHADASLQDIRDRYLRGSLQYTQVLHMLRSLNQELDNAQVPVDTNQVIDINGVVQSQY